MTTSFIQKFQMPRASRLGDVALLISIILIGTVFPRLMLLGLFPAVDDGYYTYVTQQIHHSLVNGQGLPEVGWLSLYPMLCSWVFSLQYNPFISLRLIDLGTAIVMAFLLYKVLVRTCNNNTGAALITLIFTFTMNQFVFIDSGFKNSITVAFIPLFLALYVGMGAIQHKKSNNAWWIAGALTALSIVLRETFVPFALLGLISAFIVQGKMAGLRFFIGGVVTGIVLIGGILIARGGVAEAIAAYHSTGVILTGDVLGDRRLHFVSYGMMAIRVSSIALAFSILAFIVLSVLLFLRRTGLLAVAFWLSFIGVSFIEPATKISYPYHFTIAFPGFAGLCALALHEIIRLWSTMKWMQGKVSNILAVAGILLLATWLYFSCSMLAMAHWPVTLETLAVASSGKWPEKFTNQSEYLFMAAEIEKIIPENGTLSIIKNMHGLYPLTGHLPSTYRLIDLSATTVLLDFSVPAIRQTLLDCAPDVLVFTTKEDKSLFEAVLATEIYEPAVKIPFGRQNPGSFDGVIIFRKTKETGCLEKQGLTDWTRYDAASSWGVMGEGFPYDLLDPLLHIARISPESKHQEHAIGKAEILQETQI